ncbi:expressed unknown protein [Seminavis robusta]|uniref:Uncharacterized protein n=1 Tax=Seminavis robusta TaxID=568900 RepID=A0A9N8ECV8_9STRA|nr:expressed unknown protein [Seminavis robusta]|eukprot:Sro989_g228510.1 n/a (141) ;mRNA; f:29397-29819
MRSTSIGMSSSADSASCSSGGKHDRRYKKRSNNALIDDEVAVPESENRSHTEVRSGRTSESRNNAARKQKEEDNDDSYGLGCGFGCGRWRHDPQDPFGVMSRVRTMIHDRFSSRVDFSEEPDYQRTRRYPATVNFVEHRL